MNAVKIPPYSALRRFSPAVTHRLSRINATLARIDAADIWPASAEALRFNAQVGTIHYSTLIEGNRLGILEAQRAARGELDRSTRAEIELVNYVDALELLDRRLAEDELQITEDLFKLVHYEATKGLGAPEGPFKPNHEGEWRDGEAGVWDPIAQLLVHTGSVQKEVRPRMLGLIDWVNDKLTDRVAWPPPVVAGILHFNIAEVHPFADGNGRTARLLTTALLMKTEYAPGRLFNFDAHYGKNKDAYLDALRSVRQQTLNQEQWMQYFLNGLAAEYERVAAEIDRLGAIGRTAGGQRLQLSDSQQKGLTDLSLRRIAEFKRSEYEQAAGVSRNTATTDLNKLAEAGVVQRRGDGPSRRYRLATVVAANPWSGRGGGRPREWTEERIGRELRELVGNRTVFPSIADFKAAGRERLYSAIQRHGGTTLWAERLGITLGGRRPA